jgi:hypothetical protein
VAKKKPSVQVSLKMKIPDSLLQFEKRLQKKIPGMMYRVAVAGKSFWKTLAGQKLKSSRTRYQKAIDMETKDTVFTLKLEGFLPVVVERGGTGFNLQPGFLKNKQFRVIPLNINRYVNMTKPSMYRTVSVNTTTTTTGKNWQHPGWKNPANLIDEVLKELDQTIIPKELKKALEGMDKP